MNRQTTLYYKEGSSDKVYEIFIEPKDDGGLPPIRSSRQVPVSERQRIWKECLSEQLSLKGMRQAAQD